MKVPAIRRHHKTTLGCFHSIASSFTRLFREDPIGVDVAGRNSPPPTPRGVLLRGSATRVASFLCRFCRSAMRSRPARPRAAVRFLFLPTCLLVRLSKSNSSKIHRCERLLPTMEAQLRQRGAQKLYAPRCKTQRLYRLYTIIPVLLALPKYSVAAGLPIIGNRLRDHCEA